MRKNQSDVGIFVELNNGDLDCSKQFYYRKLSQKLHNFIAATIKIIHIKLHHIRSKQSPTIKPQKLSKAKKFSLYYCIYPITIPF